MKTSLAVIGLSFALLTLFLKFTDKVPCNAYIGRADTLRIASRQTSASYKVTVYMPAGYKTSSTARYPVIYQLSGNHLGKAVAGVLAGLNRCGGECPEAMSVAIGYDYSDANEPENRDYTYPPPSSLMQAAGDKRGGALHFFRFLTEELVPYIDRNYPTIAAPEGRTLAGDTLAGFFTLYAMLNSGKEKNPGAFGNYLCILPYNPYDDNNAYLIGMEAEYDLARPASFPATLCLALPESARELRMVTWNIISHRLSFWNFPGFHFKLMLLPPEKRTNNIHHSYHEGLRYILSRSGARAAAQNG